MKKTLRAVRGKLAESLDYNDRHWLHHLLEADAAPVDGQPTPGQPETMLSHSSIDAAIDDELMDAAKKAMGGASTTVENKNRKRTLRELFEAEGDEDADLDAGADAEPAGDDAATVQKPAIDAQAFAAEMARLVQHANSLFDLEGVVLRRGLNYVAKNHGEESMIAVKDILMQDYEVSLERSNSDESPTDLTHFAKGAGPTSGGA